MPVFRRPDTDGADQRARTQFDVADDMLVGTFGLFLQILVTETNAAPGDASLNTRGLHLTPSESGRLAPSVNSGHALHGLRLRLRDRILSLVLSLSPAWESWGGVACTGLWCLTRGSSSRPSSIKVQGLGSYYGLLNGSLERDSGLELGRQSTWMTSRRL